MTPCRRRCRAIPSSASRAAHRIVAATAVDVDVDEPWRDERIGGLRRCGATRTLVELDLHDPPVLDADPPGGDPVVEDQPAIDGRGVGRHASRGTRIASRASTSNCTSRA